MDNTKEKLFTEFAPLSTQQWMDKIVADLKGADFEKKLVWKTNEGFNVQPFYRREDISGLKATESLPGEFPYVRGTKRDNEWLVRQDIQVTDFAQANQKALALLGKGVDSLGFRINKSDISKENLNILLDGLELTAIEINFHTCNMHSVKLLSLFVEYLKEKQYDLSAIRGSIDIDFIRPIVKRGVAKEQWLTVMTEAFKVAEALPNFRLINVNAFMFNNAGSFITQELGYALAWGNELLSRLTDQGLSVADVAKKLKFNFGIGANYFMEIAKFRAARWLWAEIVKAYAPEAKTEIDEAAKMNIFAQTSEFNLSLYDAHVNMLRTQTEAMSASIAGVDSLLVSPFDQSYKTPDEFSERIARNQQLLLKEECHFDKVVDPSGGSYYIETLTNDIAREAWKLFLETEEKGFFESVKDGSIQQTINATAEKRFKLLAQRREVLLGTNQFPNFTEVAAGKIKNEAHECGCGGKHAPSTITTLNTLPLSNQFDALRLTTERSGKEVKAFMLTIGNLAMRLARSQFSSNFLACAGYKPIDNLGFETVEAGVEAARKAGAQIIVLCSSDDEYATFAPQAYELTQGKEILIVAGAPASMDDLKALGIEHFINVRSNVLETLQSLNAKLGIQ